ncbi:MAG: GNAT family N-acetyltransferase [Acidovorax soli]|uniref:GNAT family N-acetyltransferase n=1 Tax=Acidovorax soli TaxID=592050 RepID=UPI0026F1176D|nr:GNAT family protein [Acidovorax soli]MCM2348343.1 GNAT family N-acetyltransferase [Acidovorax soli]
MQAQRTTDMELVRTIITHPKIYPWVTDDEAPRAKDFVPLPADEDRVLYVLVNDGQARGIFAFYQQNAATTEAHTCVLPEMWGRTHLAARAAIAWTFENTAFHRITTSVPQDNPLAGRLARRAGMTHYGHNPSSFLRNGALLGMDLFGISRKEPQCQSQQQW